METEDGAVNAKTQKEKVREDESTALRRASSMPASSSQLKASMPSSVWTVELRYVSF